MNLFMFINCCGRFRLNDTPLIYSEHLNNSQNSGSSFLELDSASKERCLVEEKNLSLVLNGIGNRPLISFMEMLSLLFAMLSSEVFTHFLM